MSASGLLNVMRREAGRAAGQKALVRMGVVESYDPSHYAVKVLIQPENYETGWLPVATPWVGDGWGLYAPPTPGDVVDVHFQEGGKEAGYASLRYFGNRAQPLAVNSGEFWLVHKSGSYFKFTNDGKASYNGQVEIDAAAPTVNVTATTAVHVTAPHITLGSQGETLHQLVTDALVALYNSVTVP